MPKDNLTWKNSSNNELFSMYVATHRNVGLYMLFPFMLIVAAYTFLYGVPDGSALDAVMMLLIGASVFVALQQALYGYILRAPVMRRHLYTALIAVGKAAYIPMGLAALFFPLQSDMIYSHLLGYVVIMFAMMYCTMVSSAYLPLMLYEVSLFLGFGLMMVVMNFNTQEAALVAPVMITVAGMAVFSGRQFYTNARSLVQQRYQLRLAAIQAEAASRAKMDFLATMSHEIRTPLNGIMGMIHFMNDMDLDAKQRDCISTMQNCSATLLNTLDDILDLSKIEAGKFEITNTDFSLRHLVKNVHTLMLQKAEQKGVAVYLDYNENIPMYIKSDPNRLQQILMNMISNAIKFTNDGYVRISVSMRDGTSPVLRFEVKDTGIGMTPAQLKKMFQKFSQADGNIAGKFGGTGLGLSISKQLIELMSGRVGVESEHGEGSLFWFELPLVRGAETVIASDSIALDFEPGSRILVAEDNHINQVILVRLLEKYGIHCDVAPDGREAVRMAKENAGRYRLVLMDMQMPHMDGIEATKAIHALGPQWKVLPIVGLTGNVLEQHIQQCLDAGMIDHISKPIDPKILYQKIHPFLKAADAPIKVVEPEKPLSTADELRVIMGDEYARKFIINAHNEIHKLYNNIASAYSQRDIDVIRRNAHEMKSVSGAIGLYGVMSASEMLESLSQQQGEEDSIGPCIIGLGDALAEEIRKAA